MILYALTIFLSAFLLFQVQPLIGKYILPWFGGTPAVWTTCMLFFQVVLLAGYAYAHATGRALSSRKQATLHLMLLVVSLALLPIIPSGAFWKPEGPEHPVFRILLLLLATIGAPYFLVSTTGPLLQDWFSRTNPGRSPYRLYALSNVGSLLALATYPFVVEPALRLNVQCRLWSAGYVGFVLLCGTCAVRIMLRGRALTHAPAIKGSDPSHPPGEERPGAFTVLLWLLLSACGSLMLLATTNQMCQEVAVVPFLWVLPLALYLLTFIICFDSPRWYFRPAFMVLLGISAGVMVAVLATGVRLSLPLQVTAYSAAMFILCMVCHGELVRLKPSPRHLTLFYLAVSAGGALGGVFVVLVATYVFDGYWEYHLGLVLVCLLFLVTTFRDRRWFLSPLRGGSRAAAELVSRAWLMMVAGVVVLCMMLLRDVDKFHEDVTVSTRNFYGVLRIEEEYGDEIRMMHGRIEHGFQFTEEEFRLWPTSYYAPPTGIGLLMENHPARLRKTSLCIGVVGQGTGTIAAWGEAGDILRYYEINPEVMRLCEEHFTYIQDARGRGARVDVVLGDARLEMERELARGQSQQFDVLVVDAFSSDAIPMHLLTIECGEIYWKHLKPDGVLAVHVTNRYLDLVPVVRGLAEAAGRRALLIDSDKDEEIGASSSVWVLITRDTGVLENEAIINASMKFPDDQTPLRWTDDYGSLWQVMKH